MYRKKRAVAVLMCATFALVAAAPLVQSDGETVHMIYKDENGPPSTCAETWDFLAPSDGTWSAHVENNGMRWIIFDMIDLGTNDLVIDREMYRYAVYGDVFDTPPVDVVGGHLYSITGTPNGPLDTYVLVTDVFTPAGAQPPVADFTVSADGLTVDVDASASYDPDGTIVSWEWDWGDGTTGTGETASHTYVPPLTAAPVASPTLGIPPPPYVIYGWTYDASATILPDCMVTVTNVRLGMSTTVMSDSSGSYNCDLNLIGGEDYPYVNGDEILIEAVKGELSGSATIVVDTAIPYIQVDLVLEGEEPPEPFDVTITLTVTDNDGLSTTVSQTVTLYP